MDKKKLKVLEKGSDIYSEQSVFRTNFVTVFKMEWGIQGKSEH